MMPRIFLDIDDVIFNWNDCYAKKFNTKLPKSWSKSNLMNKRLKLLTKDKSFWLNLTVKNYPDFQPSGFVSARGIPKSWTKESLKINNIPGRSNVYQVNWGQSKIETLKSLNVEIFVDDKFETFKECHKNGIFCLLMSASTNKKYKTKYRIDRLNYVEILNLYKQWLGSKSTVIL